MNARPSRRIAIVGVFASAIVVFLSERSLPAQEPTPPLRDAVETYMDADDASADLALKEILARKDATAEALVAAIVADPPPSPARVDDVVFHRGERLVATYAAPAPRDASSPRLPVVFDVSGGAFAAHFGAPDGFVVAFVSGYTPPQFSDEGRDGFLKVLRRAAWRMRGDPDRLFLAGFSWAGHASYDTALHRPRVLRGIVTGGGGPRRTHFRLFRNFVGATVLSFCGEKDDRELVWNLRETALVASKNAFEAALVLDKEAGHVFPIEGAERAPAFLKGATAPDAALRTKIAATPLFADGPNVECPWLRIDVVDEKRVAIPDRVPVDGTASYDEQRRRTVRAYEKAVVKVECKWTLEEGGDAAAHKTILELKSDGVKAATVLLRAPFAAPHRRVFVRAKGATLLEGPLEVDRATLLSELRRGGDRLRPILKTVPIAF